MLLDTSTDRDFISAHFKRNHKLRLVNSEIKNIQLADSRRVPVQQFASLMQIKQGIISFTVAGPLMKDLSHNVMAGFNWLHHNKLHINCNTSSLNVQRHGMEL